MDVKSVAFSALWTSIFMFLKVFCTDDQMPEWPQLKFDGEHKVLLRTSSLETFYKCLCSNTQPVCRYGYRYRLSLFYSARSSLELQTEDVDQDNVKGNSFFCYSGPFGTSSGFLSCTRSSDSLISDPLKWCTIMTFCQPFCINLKQEDKYNECSFKSINMMWLTTKLEWKNFGNVPEFKSGFCTVEKPFLSTTLSPRTTDEDTTEGISTPGSTDQDGGLTSEPRSQGSKTSDNKSLTAATAAGWILFALAFGIIVLLIIFLCRKQRDLSEKQNFESSVSLSRADTEKSAKSESDAKSKEPDSRQPVADTSKSGSDYDYCSAYGLYASDYNIIVEDKTAAASRKLSKLNTIKTSSVGNDVPSTVATLSQAKSAAESGYSFAGQPVAFEDSKIEANTSDREKYVKHDHTNLESGYDLASIKTDTYNLASESLPIGEPGKQAKIYNGDSADPFKNTEYDKLKNGKINLTEVVDVTAPDTYNKGSTLFEERNKI